MPPELGMEKMKLFISDDDGNYVPFEGLKNYAKLCEKEKYSGYLEELSEFGEKLQEDIIRGQIEELRKKIEEQKQYDAILMNGSLFMELLSRHEIREEDKGFYYSGLMVFTSPKVPMDKAYLMFLDMADEVIACFEQEKESCEYVKTEPKKCHCRICGQAYTNKAEAKECARSHSWQNRRGRR